MTEFNSGRGGRDDDIVDLEAQPVNATGNSAEGSSREPIKQEPQVPSPWLTSSTVSTRFRFSSGF